jgi:hypothetical protein
MGVRERYRTSFLPFLPPARIFLNLDFGLIGYSEMGQHHTACAVGDDPESTGAVRPPFAPKFSNGAAVRVGVIVSAVSASTVLADFPLLLYLSVSLHRIQNCFLPLLPLVPSSSRLIYPL